ncbi:hypothetical protein QWA68_012671 [Fusarium oxysporum]|nr:hypothetical protein QWA68_012671 [Fusarium oxysporum]
METEAGVLDAVDAAAGAMVVAVTMTVDIGKVVLFRVKPLFTPSPILLLFTMDLQPPQDMQPAFNMDNFLRTSLSLPGRHYPRTNSLLKEVRTPHLNYRGSTLSADETQGPSMRRSFIDNNELANDITWHARPETRDSRRRGVPLDFRGPTILSYKRQVVIPMDEDMPYVDRSQQPSAPMVLAICGGCKKPGHNIIQCCVKDENGFTTGCGSFSKDTLLKKRACLPPLKTKHSFWYPLMWKWVKANPSADTSHLFP